MGRPLKKRKVVEHRTPPEYPWERQLEETDKAFAAFVEYRDMPPGHRALEKLAQKHGTLRVNFERWSVAWDWRARVAEYDIWRDRQGREAALQEIKEMNKRHVNMAMSFQGAAALALQKIIKAEQQNTTSTLRPNEVAALADLGARLERLSRGEPESTSQMTHAGQVKVDTWADLLAESARSKN